MARYTGPVCRLCRRKPPSRPKTKVHVGPRPDPPVQNQGGGWSRADEAAKNQGGGWSRAGEAVKTPAGDNEQAEAEFCDEMASMNAAQRRATMTTRLIRRGEAATEPDLDWQASTMEQRIAAVWDLTLACLAWTKPDADQPRLGRSVCRTERRRG